MSTTEENSPKPNPAPRFAMGRNLMLGAAVVVCLGVLFLPTACDGSILPSFLTLAVHQKLIAAYVLGLLTMAVILKAN